MPPPKPVIFIEIVNAEAVAKRWVALSVRFGQTGDLNPRPDSHDARALPRQRCLDH